MKTSFHRRQLSGIAALGILLVTAALSAVLGIWNVRSVSAQDAPGGVVGADPIEPPPDTAVAVRIKSPAAQMHFTAGLPLRLLADAWGRDEYTCPPGHPPYACTD